MANTDDAAKSTDRTIGNLPDSISKEPVVPRKEYSSPKLTVYGSKENLRKMGKESLIDLFSVDHEQG